MDFPEVVVGCFDTGWWIGGYTVAISKARQRSTDGTSPARKNRCILCITCTRATYPSSSLKLKIALLSQHIFTKASFLFIQLHKPDSYSLKFQHSCAELLLADVWTWGHPPTTPTISKSMRMQRFTVPSDGGFFLAILVLIQQTLFPLPLTPRHLWAPHCKSQQFFGQGNEWWNRIFKYDVKSKRQIYESFFLKKRSSQRILKITWNWSQSARVTIFIVKNRHIYGFTISKTEYCS